MCSFRYAGGLVLFSRRMPHFFVKEAVPLHKGGLGPRKEG